MNAATEIFYRLFGIAFFLLLLFCYTLPAKGIECPEGSKKIEERMEGGKIRVKCKCLPGKFMINKKCIEGKWDDWQRVSAYSPRDATCEEQGGQVIGETAMDIWERTEEVTPEPGTSCLCKWRACFRETTIICSREVQEEAFFLNKDGLRTPFRKVRTITVDDKLTKRAPLIGEAATTGLVHAPMGPSRCFCSPPDGGAESIGSCR